MYIWGGTAIPARVYLHNTIRVSVHIACICEEKDVDQFMTRTRIYTPDCIYLYLRYNKSPHRGPFFPLHPNLIKNTKWQPSFLKNLLGYGKYIIVYINHLFHKGLKLYPKYPHHLIYHLNDTSTHYIVFFPLKINLYQF